MVNSTYGYVFGFYAVYRLRKGLFPANMDTSYAKFNTQLFNGVYASIHQHKGNALGQLVDSMLSSVYLLDLPDVFFIRRIIQDAEQSGVATYGWTSNEFVAEKHRFNILLEHLQYYEDLEDPIRTAGLYLLINGDQRFQDALTRFLLVLLAIALEYNEVFVRTRNNIQLSDFLPNRVFLYLENIWSEGDVVSNLYSFCKELFEDSHFYNFLQKSNDEIQCRSKDRLKNADIQLWDNCGDWIAHTYDDLKYIVRGIENRLHLERARTGRRGRLCGLFASKIYEDSRVSMTARAILSGGLSDDADLRGDSVRQEAYAQSSRSQISKFRLAPSGTMDRTDKRDESIKRVMNSLKHRPYRAVNLTGGVPANVMSTAYFGGEKRC